MAVSARASGAGRPQVAYRRIVVPLAPDGGSSAAVEAACRLAADHGAVVTALVVVEVPRELPLEAHMLPEYAQAKKLLAEAEAIGDLRGVTVDRSVVRARRAGEAVVEVAEDTGCELIVLQARRRPGRGSHRPVFGRTAQFVLKHAPCRVLLSIQADR